MDEDLGGRDDVPSRNALLAIGAVFAVVGGYTDAYAYLAHGHVFANAQSGNVVFVGLFASEGQWSEAARHLPPIAAFVLGVAVANLIGVKPQKRLFRATLICQVFELAVVCALILLGRRLPDAVIVPAISFVAAVQSATLTRIGSWSFNSTMTTGNLRTAAAAFVLWLQGREAADNRAKALAFALICGAFLAGAILGGVFTRLDEGRALIPCAAIVVAGIALTWRERLERMGTSRAAPDAKGIQ
jgi:uncharacterized membrane protein YoaK (UPF0700 family)